jgi:hypothetical protein
MTTPGLTIQFVKDDTPHRTMVGYNEVTVDGPPAIGRLYVRKAALERIGSPDQLVITIGPDSA